MRMAIPAIVFLAAFSGSCTTYPGDAPIVDGGPIAAEGSAVALGQPVVAGPVVLTPMAIVEDSRCAAGMQCVWAGQVIVTTRIDGAGWRETKDLIAGRVHMSHGLAISAVTIAPEQKAGQEIAAEDYRITFRVTDRMPIMNAKGAAPQ